MRVDEGGEAANAENVAARSIYRQSVSRSSPRSAVSQFERGDMYAGRCCGVDVDP